MSLKGLPSNHSNDGEGWFRPTRWTLLRSARDGNDQALNELFKMYWPPVYASFRDKVGNHHDAEDLTQSLLMDVYRRNDLANLDPGNGTFRSFIKKAIKHFFANHVAVMTAIKRGGKEKIVSIDAEDSKYLDLPKNSPNDDPSLLFDRRWIATIVLQSISELRQEYAGRGKSSDFEVIEEYLLIGDKAGNYRELGEVLGLKETAARVAVHRSRKRLCQLIRDNVRETVDNNEDLEDELGYLLKLMGLDLPDP